MHVSIITARAGSKSIVDKNIVPIAGKPVIAYPIEASEGAKTIGKTYVSTDGDKIASVSRDYGATIIPRPDSLGGDHINHGDVIKHAVEAVDAMVPDLEIVVLLLGNTVMISSELIDDAVNLLVSRPDVDSVMTVWEAADDHPNRALEVAADGLITTYGGPRDVSTERQSYKKAYYYYQSVWAFRKECVQHRDGPSPWWWMGKRSLAIKRPWITGRDSNGPYDVPFHEWWAANPEIAKRLDAMTLD